MASKQRARVPTQPSRTAATRERSPRLEICILAGGLSSRMGSDKSKLQVGGKSLLSHIRRTARTLNIPVRVIRRDLVSRCGPVGGIYTALKTTSADAVLFLACDMPQVSETLLRKLLEQSASQTKAIFTWSDDTAGFPFLLRREMLPVVEKLLLDKSYTLQILAKETRAQKFHPTLKLKLELLNINTPEDWHRLKKAF